MSNGAAPSGGGAHIAQQALARFGRIDTVVNNAGVFVASPSPTTPTTTTEGVVEGALHVGPGGRGAVLAGVDQ
jgi:NAD(P)-dependent dehydrogenase (short-subunit alcohol dehydrogenase family)